MGTTQTFNKHKTIIIINVDGIVIDYSANMDPGSLLSLLEASQSAVESSDLALRAAEEALTAARAANTQAKAALKAVKEFSAGGEIEIQTEHKRAKCETCRKKRCLHGELLQESLCKDPSGYIVRAIGESWTAKYLGKIGKIISCNQSKQQKFLNIQWENLSRTENFTFSSKSGPKFVIECKLKPEFPELQMKEKNLNERNSPIAVNCPSCRLKPCQRGKFLTEALPNPSGLKVRSIGKSFPERYRDALGTIIIKQGSHVTLRWDNTGEIRENTINSKSGPRFVIECEYERVSSTELSPSPASNHISVEDISLDDDSDDETEDFIMLSSNKNPVVDIDEEEESIKADKGFEEESLSFLMDHGHLARITQKIVWVEDKDKSSFLLDYLDAIGGDHKTIIVAEHTNMSSVSQICTSNGYPCPFIAGEVGEEVSKYEERKANLLKEFFSGRSRLLLLTPRFVATTKLVDVSCDHIIMYDSMIRYGMLWYDRAICKTGRHGKFGLATTFFNDGDAHCSLKLFKFLNICNQEVPLWLYDMT